MNELVQLIIVIVAWGILIAANIVVWTAFVLALRELAITRRLRKGTPDQ